MDRIFLKKSERHLWTKINTNFLILMNGCDIFVGNCQRQFWSWSIRSWLKICERILNVYRMIYRFRKVNGRLWKNILSWIIMKKFFWIILNNVECGKYTVLKPTNNQWPHIGSYYQSCGNSTVLKLGFLTCMPLNFSWSPDTERSMNHDDKLWWFPYNFWRTYTLVNRKVSATRLYILLHKTLCFQFYRTMVSGGDGPLGTSTWCNYPGGKKIDTLDGSHACSVSKKKIFEKYFKTTR